MSLTGNKSKKVCKLLPNCTFGTSCKYLHPIENKSKDVITKEISQLSAKEKKIYSPTVSPEGKEYPEETVRLGSERVTNGPYIISIAYSRRIRPDEQKNNLRWMFRNIDRRRDYYQLKYDMMVDNKKIDLEKVYKLDLKRIWKVLIIALKEKDWNFFQLIDCFNNISSTLFFTGDFIDFFSTFGPKPSKEVCDEEKEKLLAEKDKFELILGKDHNLIYWIIHSCKFPLNLLKQWKTYQDIHEKRKKENLEAINKFVRCSVLSRICESY